MKDSMLRVRRRGVGTRRRVIGTSANRVSGRSRVSRSGTEHGNARRHDPERSNKQFWSVVLATPPQQALGSSKWRGDWLARTNAHSLERQTGETACVVCNGALCKPILTTQVTSPSTIRIQSFRRKSATTRCVSEPRRCRKHLLFSQFLRLSCSQKRKVLLAIALALYLQRSCRFAPIVAAVCGRPSPHTPRRRPRGYFIVNAAVMVQVSDPNEAFPCASHPLGQGRAGFYRYGPRFQAPLAGGPHVSLCEMKQHLSTAFICTDANYSLSQEPPNFFVWRPHKLLRNSSRAGHHM